MTAAFFRGDAGFADPNVYRFLEAEGYLGGLACFRAALGVVEAMLVTGCVEIETPIMVLFTM